MRIPRVDNEDFILKVLYDFFWTNKRGGRSSMLFFLTQQLLQKLQNYAVSR